MEPDTDSEFVIVKVNSEILKTYEIEHKVNNILYTENKSKNNLSTSMPLSLCYPNEKEQLCVMYI